jgi:hypothetical protein
MIAGHVLKPGRWTGRWTMDWTMDDGLDDGRWTGRWTMDDFYLATAVSTNSVSRIRSYLKVHTSDHE